MSEQPEALRLARDLADCWDGCENHHAYALHRCAITLLRQQHAEIERLRTEREEDHGVIARWRGRTLRAEAEIERLRAENELLRDALRPIKL